MTLGGMLASVLSDEKAASKDRHAVWHDSDDEAPVTTTDPIWASKRRKIAEGSQHERFQLPTKVTSRELKQKSTGTTFKIAKQNDKSNRFIGSDCVLRIEFESNGKYMGVLRKGTRGLQVFKVDEHKSKSNERFRLGPGLQDIILDNYSITSFAFGGRGILMIVGTFSTILQKYRVASAIATLSKGSNESCYDRIYNGTGDCNMYAVSCHDNGTVLLCDSRTNCAIHELHVNSKRCAGVGFYPNRNAVILSDVDANVYHWDIKSGRCAYKFHDDYSVHVSSFGSCQGTGDGYGTGAFIANGSNSGYLNLFPVSNNIDSVGDLISPIPTKSFGNLSTEVTSIAVEPTGAFVAYTSVHKKNAIRLIHVPSLSVVSNWPDDKLYIGRPTTVAFCPNYNTFVVGTRAGKIQCYKIIY
ncbi:bifunctional WD40-YVTN repeat-like-containing domain superfamily/U3 small nucleolar RNA-associated protein 18/WD40-repeat-containing domain superfamily [Babesia duncani]|uniref:Bifunctional WD40-YVTN repeat-like-containing domain superfamily/U3 small nucleolar RNA-associated protein 18/WD40-repeat-containing domain superfamily n=1 Tax=Babesia duncani TaxID=323732 RepID=A0AAD9PI08_9APIC|nr:bifunctional WD40-YVTN repeat-like-containing domain superfamily/U3 small nucleolar RNA-associated protein 18/WD40-repeat-containing domain superfamily [Babesia duncani]